ncbi:MAG: saccharopine dehydrogenase NADP-binding domain-containing protein [Deltaproteobacteria bacterium]|nr:saccharopine dehydrogenase NADP-binding domain-containing protein [Deltaproteobacteria bacterium]
MSSLHTYVVLGAGRQGGAVVYDLILHGNAQKIYLVDADEKQLQTQVQRLNHFSKKTIVEGAVASFENEKEMKAIFRKARACLSAAPYFLNVNLARWVLEEKTHFCDLGGNTDIVFQELELAELAKNNGVSLIPDCGLAPGLCNMIVAYSLENFDQVDSVKMFCGGLPKHPEPPFYYNLFFSIHGLVNEYFGDATVLRNGKRVTIPTMTELEEIQFPEPIGKCEAFVTTGGTSTCPWTFDGKIRNFEYKTVRYPGHFQKMKAYEELGLLEEEDTKNQFKKFLEKKLWKPGVEDVVVLRLLVEGTHLKKSKKTQYNLMDYYDHETGFSAMERTTGFSAALVLEAQAQGEVSPGAHRLETIVFKDLPEKLWQRGLHLQTTLA